MKNRRCTKCSEVKPESEFYFSSKSEGIRQGWCKSCVKQYDKEHKEKRKRYDKERRKKYYEEHKEHIEAYHKKYNEENKEHVKELRQKHSEKRRAYVKAKRTTTVLFIYEYFLVHHCIDCGESDPIVLEFDHERGKKTMTVSAMVGRGYHLERIKAEIAKCEVRCANCHMRRHAIENNTLMVQVIEETC